MHDKAMHIYIDRGGGRWEVVDDRVEGQGNHPTPQTVVAGGIVAGEGGDSGRW